MLALGVDVAANRALDCVLMRGSPGQLRLEGEPHICQPEGLVDEARQLGQPDVIAIDSPPKPGTTGSSRQAERDLFQRGIGIFWTPTTWDKPFYDWMKVGQRTFKAAADAGYSLYQEGPVLGSAIEVFPHASAVTLRGAVWPPGTHRSNRTKRAWRLDVLADAGVDVTHLTNLDKVDAALAALTGLYATAGEFTPIGLPDEGVIVVPARGLPERYDREAP